MGMLLALMAGLYLPSSGGWETFFHGATQLAIVLLFFFYGLRISRQAVVEGLLHWRLQLLVLLCTFALFPLFFWGLHPLLSAILGPGFALGMLYLACVPSTVQSSVAFTSIAGGNVAAGVCCASLSSLVGVFVTPILVALFFPPEMMAGGEGLCLDSVAQIATFILLPFALGQMLQHKLANWFSRRRAWVSWSDQVTVWLLIYTSFSAATQQDYWGKMQMVDLLLLAFACFGLLLLVLASTYGLARLFRFSHEDVIVIVFCGSKKSLTGGAPMMLALFGYVDNNLLLPLMLFHQIQLLSCAQLARYWKKKAEREKDASGANHLA